MDPDYVDDDDDDEGRDDDMVEEEEFFLPAGRDQNAMYLDPALDPDHVPPMDNAFFDRIQRARAGAAEAERRPGYAVADDASQLDLIALMVLHYATATQGEKTALPFQTAKNQQEIKFSAF